MATYTVKRGDTAQVFRAVLYSNGMGISLHGATVFFIMKSTSGSAYICREAGIISEGGGFVEFDCGITGNEIAIRTAGTFRVEWEIMFANGRRMTVPNDSEITLIIRPDLGDAVV